MKKITVIGSLNMDLVVQVKKMPKVGQTVMGSNFKEIPGGKGANQAVAMGRLGAKVNMIGKVGTDGFGQSLLSALEKDKINIAYIGQEDNTSTGVALINVNEEGNNSIVVAPGANYKLNKEDIDASLDAIKGSKIVVLQLEIPLETVKYALEKSKELGKYTILNPAPAVKLEDEIIKNIDLLTPNETELEILSGVEIKKEEDLFTAAKALMKKGIKELIVTLGEKGALYINREKMKSYKAYNVKAVDTTAAGDSFTGAIATALMNDKNIDEAIDFASKVGALSVTKEGAQSSLPYLEEVMKFKEA